jgi:hypothetical protein
MAQRGTMLTTIIGIVDRERGGGFYTHIHDPVKGMLPHAPLPPILKGNWSSLLTMILLVHPLIQLVVHAC